MKSLPGLLIEYLITGSGLLMVFWFAGALEIMPMPDGLRPLQISVVTAGFLLPNIYLAGMLVDFVSKISTDVLAKLLDDYWHPKCATKLRDGLPAYLRWLLPRGPKKYDTKIDTAELFERSERLSEQFEMRSSRDRIARGAFLNSTILTILIGSAVFTSEKIAFSHLVGAIVLTTLVFLMWRRFKRLSSRWKHEAFKAIVADKGQSALEK
ncbi:hypothetical protein [Pararhizobium sp. IMCC21322]|uniref:hypothetical protein n=1 Tax=Pararhizobium sp. IMCC21322 TaxID=3067903 RepID=UPI0027420FA4|nr:hypothetical protein [Pararhizobium sp. IMCC21322]